MGLLLLHISDCLHPRAGRKLLSSTINQCLLAAPAPDTSPNESTGEGIFILVCWKKHIRPEVSSPLQAQRP